MLPNTCQIKFTATMKVTWGYYIVLLAILALVTGQCTKENLRVELFEDDEIFTDSPPMLSRTVGDSFVIGCRRCDVTRGAPNWYHPNRTEILSCNVSSSSICAEYDANDNLIQYLRFTSVTTSVAGTYRCTARQRIIINIIEPAVASTSVMFRESSYSIDEDEGSVRIVLMLNSSSANDITIQITNDDNDSATRGSDYVAGPYPIMIPAGGTTGSYEISVVVDNMLESEELFQLTIDTNTLPHGIILGSPDSATVTIRNDDTTVIGFQHSTYSVIEGDQLVQPVIILSNPMSTDLVINIRDKNGTATDGADYSSGPYSITLPAEMTNVSFDISITDDDVPEPDETFCLAINSHPLPDYIEIDTKGSTITIINDDSNVFVNTTIDASTVATATITSTASTTTVITTSTTTIPAVTDTHSNTTSLNSPTLSSSQSDSNNSSSVGVIVAIVVLVIVVFIIITVIVIGIIVVWKRKKSEQHTKPEGIYYSTINETIQRIPSNKPEAVYSEMNDGQDSKEPEYMDISKSGQSTKQAGKIIMQDNPAYSAEHQVKMQDNPAYSVTNM